MNKQPIHLSIIIPAYNEERRLPLYLDSLAEYFANSSNGESVEVIVVDDGSTDGTAAVVEGKIINGSMIRLLQLSRNRGKGYAVRVGMLSALGSVRLFCDADGATPITELRKLIDAVNNGADLAVASRALPDDSRMVASRLHRKIIGTIFNLLVRCFAVPNIRDTQCGFKLFRGEVVEVLFGRQRIDGFGFDVELLFLAHKLGFSTAEIPVNWSDVSGSKVKVVTDSLRMFRDLIATRINWLFGRYRIAGKRNIL